MSARIGVGGALSFMRGNTRSVLTLLAHRQFRPDTLVAGLLAAAPADRPVAGLHLYGFNEVERTAAWQRGAARRAVSSRR